jgi:Mg-chelatase subunit ChlD
MDDDCDITEAFDRWDTGNEDVVDIECVVMLDISGSMHAEAGKAYEAMWGIKSALDTVDASCTVLTFGSDSQVLYSADEKAGINLRNAGVGGATAPLRGLRYAQDVLAYSERAVKIAILITDGEWSESEKCDRVVQTLREAGVLTALAYIPTQVRGVKAETLNHHNAEVVSVISDAGSLFALGQALVNIGIESNLAR